jgi:hypothetical protein
LKDVGKKRPAGSDGFNGRVKPLGVGRQPWAVLNEGGCWTDRKNIDR